MESKRRQIGQLLVGPLHPDAKTAKNTDTSTVSSSIIGKDLEQQPWYHGMCTRQDVESLLTKPGDFIVRTSDSHDTPSTVISFYTGRRRVHLTVEITKKGRYLIRRLREGSEKQFNTVYDLVQFYRRHRIRVRAMDGTVTEHKLIQGVPRPKWLVMSNTICFDKNSPPLGEGNFADVFIGTFEPHKGKEKFLVALKVLKAKLNDGPEARDARIGMIREGKVMSYYTHQNVVQFYGVACDQPHQVVLVIEYCPGGCLEDHLRTFKNTILVPELVTFAIESALGMRYLHSQGCLHRDLAARNCLISADGIIKIADFGLSCIEGVVEKGRMKNVPLRNSAPEVLSRRPLFTTKSDIWAYGVLLYEIFTRGGRIYPNEEDDKKVAHYIRHNPMPEMPSITPEPVKVLAKSIWVIDRNLRPTFTTIVAELRELRCSTCKPPKLSACSVNRLAGVRRTEEVIEAEAEYKSLVSVYETSTRSTTNVAEVWETASRACTPGAKPVR